MSHTRWRKKPVLVDAVQLRAGEQPGELAADVVAGRLRYCEDGSALIATLEGTMQARPGDWIIRGVKGELYPCKPDIFARTYDAACEVCGGIDTDDPPGLTCGYCAVGSRNPTALEPIPDAAHCGKTGAAIAPGTCDGRCNDCAEAPRG